MTTRALGRSAVSRGLVAAALAAFLCATPDQARADRKAADYFATRGDAAAKARRWVEAQQEYRRALEEDEHHVPARAGLADALFAAGDRAGAVEAWRLVAADAEATKPLPSAWNEAGTRAKKRLADVEAASAALAKIVDRHADSLVALAERWEAEDPSVTGSALRLALRLRPAHAKALPMFERLGSPAGDWIPIFDGRTLDGWSVSVDNPWRVEDGQLVAEVKKGANRLYNERVLRGDYDIRVEARYVEQYGGSPGFEIGAMKSAVQGTIFGVVGSEVNLQEHDGTEKSALKFSYSCPLAKIAHPYEPSEWTTYEIRFRGSKTSVVINGNELVTRGRPENRTEGQVMLVVQNQKIAFRRVEVMQR
jgi:hypothetical protein